MTDPISICRTLELPVALHQLGASETQQLCPQTRLRRIGGISGHSTCACQTWQVDIPKQSMQQVFTIMILRYLPQRMLG